MSIFLVLISLGIYGVAGIYNCSGKHKKEFTSAELDDILKHTTGMTHAESRHYIHNYR